MATGNEVSLTGFHLSELVYRQIMENCTKIIEQIANSINPAVLKSIDPVDRNGRCKEGGEKGRKVRTSVSCPFTKWGTKVCCL